MGDGAPHVSREVLAHDGAVLTTNGGRLAPTHRGFERHSYEALEEGSLYALSEESLSMMAGGDRMVAERRAYEASLRRHRRRPTPGPCMSG